MTFFEFLQWCFRDTTSGFVTVVLLGGAGEMMVLIARALGPKR